MYKIEILKSCQKDIYKLVKKHRISKQALSKVLNKLANNPFELSLKTHKVESKKYGAALSSSIDGDLRFIWNFNDQKIHIVILDVGGHSSFNKVYK